MTPMIQSILQDAPLVRAVLGDPVRAWPHAAPSDAAMPFVVWTVIGGCPLRQLSDVPPGDLWRLRLEVSAESVADAAGAVQVIRDEIERRGSVASHGPVMQDHGAGAFRTSFEVRLLQLR